MNVQPVMTDRYAVHRVIQTSHRADLLDRLTCRERAVLALVAEGHSNAAIADLLDNTSRTVETHISRIFTKLGLEATPTVHRRVLATLAHLHADVA